MDLRAEWADDWTCESQGLHRISATNNGEVKCLMKTYAIILNWNGWKDTIECLESLLRTAPSDLRVVVCDNGSSDGSPEKMKAWAEGKIEPAIAIEKLSPFMHPAIDKPIAYRELSKEESATSHAAVDPQLVLIHTGANLGYAGGNNTGIRYALTDPDCKFVWLLNNDTLVKPETLPALLAEAWKDTSIGAVSSVCYYAKDPTRVEAWGGARVNLWIGFARNTVVPQANSWFDSLYGASMLIRRQALDDIGFLDEGYFLYWDETDFCLRLRKANWKLAVAPESRLLHRVNASTGGNMQVIDRYFTASGMRILRLHSKAPNFAIGWFLAVRFARRIARLEFARCKSVWKGIQDYRDRMPITPRIH
jgi:GT2 family glycosyltransferase